MEKSENCSVEIKIARLEEKLIAADKALELARHSVSTFQLTNIITILTTIIGFVTLILKLNH